MLRIACYTQPDALVLMLALLLVFVVLGYYRKS
jgi:hypothetical protein